MTTDIEVDYLALVPLPEFTETVPSSSSATGEIGQYAVDSTYFYGCYATDSWGRVAWDSTSF
jgi:hypothetical protein